MNSEERSNEREAIRQRSQRLHATGTGNALVVADDVRSMLDSLAAVERDRDKMRAEKTADLDADMIIEAALRDVSAATARANRAEAERDELREALAGKERYEEEAERQFSEAAAEWGQITGERDEALAKLASLREHTLDSNTALRALHEQAVLYRNAVDAYCEVHGPLSTTLEWVIRHGSLSGTR